jgi:hypothetical protein
MAGLDEDAIDEVLYLARANEAAELDSYVSELSTQTKRSKAELFTAAIDPYSKNSALHYAAANGHDGEVFKCPWYKAHLTLSSWHSHYQVALLHQRGEARTGISKRSQ